MNEYKKEIDQRRTFAIISHPDAGKTTLTEKLLLFGGAIHVAGAVKSNKIKKTATSDWMEIEKQRGISVATSVMGFEYAGYKINILDTPGHQDFAEDTFRTLTAVDSVIIVIDGAKGVETQTRRLMEVCRMRKTPVMVFINKMDREGQDPFDLLDEIEKELQIRVRPLSWPIDMGQRFRGVYNIHRVHSISSLLTSSVSLRASRSQTSTPPSSSSTSRPSRQRSSVWIWNSSMAYTPSLTAKNICQAISLPVFFGSALNKLRSARAPQLLRRDRAIPTPRQGRGT